MNDYIKREDALDIVAHNNVNGEITLNRYDKIIDGIYEIPSADFAPVRHGRWIESTIPCEQYVCSECGGAAWYYDYNGDVAKSKYCPNCGARMDGEDDE